MNDTVRLFVYGTLRGGSAQNDLLRDGAYLRDASLAGSLYHLGAYPAMVPGGDHFVHGELWVCTSETLRRLDTYEGVREGLFARIEVDFDGARAWTYIAGPALDRQLSAARKIPSGRWPDHGPRAGT